MCRSKQNTSGLVTLGSGVVRNGTLVSSVQTFVGESGLVSSVLAGGVGLTKGTPGLLELTAANLYSGLTLVNAGTLLLSGADDRLLNTGSITVAGGTLDLGGYTQNTSGLVTLCPLYTSDAADDFPVLTPVGPLSYRKQHNRQSITNRGITQM